MNKVITINLGGTAFQLEETGYDALRAYLDSARSRLAGNPDRDEILSDIERALGEKFRTVLSAHKNVVLAAEVQACLDEMGPIEDSSAAAASAGGATAGGQTSGANTTQAAAGTHTPKRLYRIYEGAMLGGVCNGIGAYLNIDPTLVRIVFVLLTLAWGMGILVYLILMLVVPQARTAEEKTAAFGSVPTAQDFIRRAKAGYYEAMKSFPNRQARREWQRRFRQDVRDWRTSMRSEWTSNAQQWHANWERNWGAHPGMGFALPLVSLVHGVLVIAWICALISLLATSTVFGIALPAGMPVWVAVIILIFVYGMLVWPLKAARRAFYYGASVGPGVAWPVFFAFDVLIWMAVVGALLWLAVHHFPQAHDAVQNIPTVFHEMVDTVRDWWRR